MSDPRIVDSDRDVWVHALSIASQNVTLDLTTAGVLGHLRHLIVTGRLVDRDTIAVPLARKMYERATSQFPPDWNEADQDFWLNEVATVIGGSDEK